MRMPRSTKFYPNRTNPSRVITSYRSSRWQPRHCNFTSGLGFDNVPHLRKPKSVCRPNLMRSTSQSKADILLLPLSKNKRSPYWNLLLFLIFQPGIVIISMSFCIGLPNYIQIGPPIANYDVISSNSTCVDLLWIVVDTNTRQSRTVVNRQQSRTDQRRIEQVEFELYRFIKMAATAS